MHIEEKRLTELRKRWQYLKPVLQQSPSRKSTEVKPANRSTGVISSQGGSFRPTSAELRKCFLHHKLSHIADDSREKASGQGKGDAPGNCSGVNQVTTPKVIKEERKFKALQELLYFSGEGETNEVRVVRLTDK